MGANPVRHILHDAKDWDFGLLEHSQGLHRNLESTSCGVDTITAPVTGTDCAKVRWTSPVPGGKSISR